MCEYSLMAYSNRLATAGEELVVHRFDTGSVGLASGLELEKVRQLRSCQADNLVAKLKRFFFPCEEEMCAAVCIPPGARLLVRDISPRLQQELGLQNSEQEVVFTETSTWGVFRDAIRFHNDSEVLLQRLDEGQRIRVLSLGSEEDEILEQPDRDFARSRK